MKQWLEHTGLQGTSHVLLQLSTWARCRLWTFLLCDHIIIHMHKMEQRTAEQSAHLCHPGICYNTAILEEDERMQLNTGPASHLQKSHKHTTMSTAAAFNPAVNHVNNAQQVRHCMWLNRTEQLVWIMRLV
jgi:hypothetical protein